MVESPFFTPEGGPAKVSPEAQTMVEQGATPVQPDISALLAQMLDLQNRVASMQAERGIPSDPVEFALANLRDHVTARKNGSVVLADSAEHGEVSSLLKSADTNLSASDAELLALAVDDLVTVFPSMDLAYLRTLARDLRKAVLVRDGKSKRDADLAVRGVSV